MPSPLSPEEINRVVRKVVRQVAAETGASGIEPAVRENPQQSVPSVAIGADHGGFDLKQDLCSYLESKLGYRVHDCGTHSTDAADYPDLAARVASRVAGGSEGCGIVIDGAGIGSCMAANKVPGIRAALCYDLSSARNSREHNHANVLTLGSGLIGGSLARQIVSEWLATPWGGGRHARRVAMIDDIEARYSNTRAQERE